MDLFYTGNDAETLFDAKKNVYKEICELAVNMLTVRSTDETEFNKLQEELTSRNVFNYISEEKKVRMTLYYVCLFANYKDEEAQKLLHENKDNFEKLFT